MNILIIGAGTVGTALGGLITQAGHTVDYLDVDQKAPRWEYDIIHYTVPMLTPKDWLAYLNEYLKAFTCTYLIVESSIVPMALDQINHPNVIYSPGS